MMLKLSGNTALHVNEDMNKGKIYLDAFIQEGGSGGSRYPQVK
jgi:hypothetical protein